MSARRAKICSVDSVDYEQVDEAEERRSDNAAQLSEQMHLQSTFSAITPHGLQQTVSVATPAQPNFGVSPHRKSNHVKHQRTQIVDMPFARSHFGTRSASCSKSTYQ